MLLRELLLRRSELVRRRDAREQVDVAARGRCARPAVTMLPRPSICALVGADVGVEPIDAARARLAAAGSRRWPSMPARSAGASPRRSAPAAAHEVVRAPAPSPPPASRCSGSPIPAGNATASRRSGWRNWLPRTMPSLGLSPKMMPSTRRWKSASSVVARRTCRPDAASAAMYACTFCTRSAGAGCVESKFGTPRRLPLASSSRASVRSMPPTPSGFQPVLRGVLHAQPVGLQFVVTSVLEEQHAECGLGEALERPRLGHEDAEQRQADAGARRLRVLLRRMARGDVADLVTEHAGELRFVVEERRGCRASDRCSRRAARRR